MEQPLRLRLAGISKTYGAVRALRDVSFELRVGEVMALLGENGAGKSTLVKVLAGLVQPDAGTIEVDGTPTELSSSAASQRAGVAVVQQEYSSVPTMTVAENLVLGDASAPTWWSRRALLRGVVEVLAQVGLEHLRPEQTVETLSVAETQLLEIARMLRRDARVLILDEPTAALSDAEIGRVLRVVRELAGEGRSVIYVTHRLDEVFQIADRVTIFRNGTSAAPRPMAEMTTDSIVTAMLGRELTSMYPERPVPGAGAAVLTARQLLADGLAAPLDLSVRSGQILGLTGQLGSGASAAVRALAGLSTIRSGSVEVDGREVQLRGRRQGIGLGIAYCSDDRKRDGIFPGVSAQKNLSAPWLSSVTQAGLLKAGVERRTSRRIASEFAFDQRRLGASVELLSGGNQQKIVLGRWLGTQPRVLLVEEPTRGVDVGARSEIYTRLRALADAGAAIVVSSSDSAEILGLCDDVAAFYHGRMTELRHHSDWSDSSLVAATMHSVGSPR